MANAGSVKETATKVALKGLLKIVDSISDEKFLDFVRSKSTNVVHPEGRIFIEKALLQFKHLLSRFSTAGRRKFIENFMYNALVKGARIRKEYSRRTGVHPPTLFVISPSMACNLGCYGCYAGEYTKKDALSLEVINRVLKEGREMGIYFYVITGGEPFYWDHIFELFEQNDDLYFMVYTNGAYLNKENAQKLGELGNVVPCISVEGFEEDTDERRGRGHFQKVTSAMDNLREAGVIFGFSATATKDNNEFIVSDEFIDFYTNKGCFLGWYFNYVPIGRKPDVSIMPTPEQRECRRRRMLEVRKVKPIILADFWNDGPMVGGCLAGGRCYLHINGDGNVEPCVFFHYAIDNVKEKSMHDIIRSPFFIEFKKRIPYSDNLLTPCSIIDQPHVLREIVEAVGAKPSHEGADTIATELVDWLDDYAERYHEIADKVWNEEYAAIDPEHYKPVETKKLEKAPV